MTGESIRFIPSLLETMGEVSGSKELIPVAEEPRDNPREPMSAASKVKSGLHSVKVKHMFSFLDKNGFLLHLLLKCLGNDCFNL